MSAAPYSSAAVTEEPCFCPCLCACRGAGMLCLGVAAVLLPPLAVALTRGVFTVSFWLCVLLTLVGWLPGQVYALYVVCIDPRVRSSEGVLVRTPV